VLQSPARIGLIIHYQKKGFFGLHAFHRASAIQPLSVISLSITEEAVLQ
jgi:hypothetical protein